MRDGFQRWQRFWFAPIPPHVYALLRILFGILGCVTLLGVSDLSTFWDLNGFVPVAGGGLGLKAFLLSEHLGRVAGTVVYVCALGSFICMTVGFRSGLSVGLSFIASLIEVSWNYLPLSGADAVVRAVLFCLLWADCSSVWSLDAWIASRKRETRYSASESTYPIAPLRLIRFQVALIYLNAGLWKLFNPNWRDGSAVHYVLQSNVYHRFPEMFPVGFDSLVSVLTYGTLLWELTFPLLILFARTRRLALVVGVLLHLGMLSTIEVGPFHFVMLASYIAFLDPFSVPELPQRVWASLRHVKTGQGAIETVTSR